MNSYQDRLAEILRDYAKYHHEVMMAEPVLHGKTIKEALAAINALNGETMDSIDIGQLYNPGIEDLELDEHRNEDQPVVYLKQVGKKIGDLRRRFGIES